MAAADYKLCDVCSGKAFYDSDLNYEDHHDAPDRKPYKVAGQKADWGYRLGYLGDWSVICDGCAETHQTRIIKAKDAGAVDAAPELLAALQSAEMALIGYIHQNDITRSALVKCRAAILKATGGAS